VLLGMAVPPPVPAAAMAQSQSASPAPETRDPVAALDAAVAAAERSLHSGELQIAESRYHTVLQQGRTMLDALRQADASPFSSLTTAQRAALQQRATATLVRAYFNLGVIQAQGGRFEQAADFFEQAAALDPAFPQLQYSLGVAYFTAHHYDKAIAPLSRAIASGNSNGNNNSAGSHAAARRMLALAWLETENYDKAADLLKDDPQRDADPSLQYAYGLALVRSNRAADAERIFSALLTAHADMAELHVVLGQAHAQQGDYNAAIESLQHALHLKPDVTDANASLGVIYLKQGKLPEAAAALRAELKVHADDYKTRHNLATVLELDGRPQEAMAEARAVLRVRPDFADARYLLGKILLAQGAAQEAVAQLEAAARLSPDSANIHYQLGQAYQKLGHTTQAQEQFAAFQQLKDRHRAATP
jgi:tetratricopeptide (TPR) repeat protein